MTTAAAKRDAGARRTGRGRASTSNAVPWSPAVAPSLTVPPPWLQTLRLDLREFVRADLPDLVALDRDKRVMRYINGGRPATPAEVEASMERILRTYRSCYGLGAWYATRRDTGAFIGWFCLKYCPPTCDVEAGYRLRHDAWGQGFATEGATELVRYGFDDLGLDRVIGVTDPGNRASQHVLMKAGLADLGYGRYYGKRLRLFSAANPHRRP